MCLCLHALAGLDTPISDPHSGIGPATLPVPLTDASRRPPHPLAHPSGRTRGGVEIHPQTICSQSGP